MLHAERLYEKRTVIKCMKHLNQSKKNIALFDCS